MSASFHIYKFKNSERGEWKICQFCGSIKCHFPRYISKNIPGNEILTFRGKFFAKPPIDKQTKQLQSDRTLKKSCSREHISALPRVNLVPDAGVCQHLGHEDAKQLQLVAHLQLCHDSLPQRGQNLRLVAAELESLNDQPLIWR